MHASTIHYETPVATIATHRRQIAGRFNATLPTCQVNIAVSPLFVSTSSTPVALAHTLLHSFAHCSSHIHHVRSCVHTTPPAAFVMYSLECRTAAGLRELFRRPLHSRRTYRQHIEHVYPSTDTSVTSNISNERTNGSPHTAFAYGTTVSDRRPREKSEFGQGGKSASKRRTMLFFVYYHRNSATIY